MSGYCIQLTSGNGQTTPAGTAFASPLVVTLSQDVQTPVALTTQQVTFSFVGGTGSAHFASGPTSSTNANSSGVATSSTVTGDTAGSVLVDAIWNTPADSSQPQVGVQFTLTVLPCGTVSQPTAASRLATTACTPTTAPPASKNYPGPGQCYGPPIACNSQTPTTVTPPTSVVPVVQPELAPATAPPAAVGAALASTGRNLEPLGWAAFALIAVGLSALGLAGRRRSLNGR